MAKSRGRPKIFSGPKILIQLPHLTHIHLQAQAKVRGTTVSQVVRDSLREAMDREWGTER